MPISSQLGTSLHTIRQPAPSKAHQHRHTRDIGISLQTHSLTTATQLALGVMSDVGQPFEGQHQTSSEGNRRRQGLAGEYHTCDFSWEDLRMEVEALVLQQEQLGRAFRAQHATQQSTASARPNASTAEPTTVSLASTESSATPSALSQPQPSTTCHQLDASRNTLDIITTDTTCLDDETSSQQNGYSSSPAAAPQQHTSVRQRRRQRQKAPPPDAPRGQADHGDNDEDGGRWEVFYAGTARSARFFKERRYLLLEFPILAVQQPQHVVELGCGYGPSLLPIVRNNPQATVTATDIAPTCITQLQEVVSREGISHHEERIKAFVADSSDLGSRHLFEGLDGDVALIMFTLSAVPPAGQAAMMSNAFASLKPGGYLCIRDHGLYDMVQLRIPAEQWLGPNMYRRGDGTLAYFFSVEDLSNKAEAAGFDVQECLYVTVNNCNRKTRQVLRRVFVHGLFRKPW